jgi:hypothetical protein
MRTLGIEWLLNRGVIPAKVGISGGRGDLDGARMRHETPAFAGVTGMVV